MVDFPHAQRVCDDLVGVRVACEKNGVIPAGSWRLLAVIHLPMNANIFPLGDRNDGRSCKH